MPENLRLRLLLDGGISLSMREANRIHKAFYNQYPAVSKYHRAVEKFVIKHGYLDTMFGYRRHFPAVLSLNKHKQSAAFRAAYNHLVQGTAAGVLFDALARVREALKGTDGKLLATVHDSILIYAPKNEWEKYAKILKNTMEDFNYDWMPIPIPASIKVGPTWGDLVEVEL